MRAQFLHTAYFIMTTSTFQIYTMEKSIISMQLFGNPSKYQLDSYKQLNIPNELLHKICALCPYETRCFLELTCKQFYYAASIDQLNKLVMHNFIIGSDEEKKEFF